MDPKLAQIIAKIGKLRALAASSNQHEAETAARLAAQLVEQYQIEEAEISAASETPEEAAEFESDNPVFVENGRNTKHWRWQLLVAISQAYGCSCVRRKNYIGSCAPAFFIAGRPSDTHIVRYMFSWLDALLVQIAPQGLDKSGRQSWLIGAVHGIAGQLQSAKKEARQTASSTARAILDRRLQEASEVLGATRKASYNGTVGDAQAYREGKAKGASIHLGQNMNAAEGIKALKA